MKNFSFISIVGLGVAVGIGIFLVGALVFLADEQEEERIYTMEESREVAEDWMRTEAPTFVFDGEDLAIEEEQVVREDISYEFTFAFTSRAAGYGDRTDEMVAQVLTDHETVVLVERGEVVRAVTDGVYSELEDRMLEEEELTDPMPSPTPAVTPTPTPTPSPTPDPGMMSVTVFFGQEGEEGRLFGIERMVPLTEQVATVSLNELLRGPTDAERAQGYFSEIPEGTVLQSLRIESGVAYADFNAALDEGVAGSARVLFIRAQIEETLKRFSAVDEVVISIDSRTDDILQP